MPSSLSLAHSCRCTCVCIRVYLPTVYGPSAPFAHHPEDAAEAPVECCSDVLPCAGTGFLVNSQHYIPLRKSPGGRVPTSKNEITSVTSERCSLRINSMKTFAQVSSETAEQADKKEHHADRSQHPAHEKSYLRQTPGMPALRNPKLPVADLNAKPQPGEQVEVLQNVVGIIVQPCFSLRSAVPGCRQAAIRNRHQESNHLNELFVLKPWKVFISFLHGASPPKSDTNDSCRSFGQAIAIDIHP